VKLLFASHTAEAEVFRVGSHHLARELSVLGHEVAHVSTPMSILSLATRPHYSQSTRARLALRGPRTDAVGTVHAVPLSLFPARVPDSGRSVRRQIIEIGYTDADCIIIDQPLLRSALSYVPNATVIYRPTDVHIDGPLSRAEAKVMHKVHAVVATSRHVLESLGQAAANLPNMVLENGVEYGRFAVEPRSERRGLIYVGAMDHRFDWEAIVCMAEAGTHTTISLIGPLPAYVPTLPVNVRLVGAVAYDLLPQMLASARVGLLPFNSSSVNTGRSPMKYYEYRAAGLAIVGRATRELLARPQEGVWLYNQHNEIGGAVHAALAGHSIAVARAEAAELDWRKRAMGLVAFIEKLRAQREGPSKS